MTERPKMSQRLSAIKQQAHLYASDQEWYIDSFEQKFAELIVRECVQVCADRGAHHDGLYSAWADDCSKRIGKHFGVEE
jgi:hypothetical protein